MALKRQNATVNALIVEQELVTDVSHLAPTDPRKLLKITDLPSNWDDIVQAETPTYDFMTWKAQKIANGTWQAREPSGTHTFGNYSK